MYGIILISIDRLQIRYLRVFLINLAVIFLFVSFLPMFVSFSVPLVFLISCFLSSHFVPFCLILCPPFFLIFAPPPFDSFPVPFRTFFCLKFFPFYHTPEPFCLIFTPFVLFPVVFCLILCPLCLISYCTLHIL